MSIFTKNLPSVSATSARVFADGMVTFYSAFKDYQNDHMNYESEAEYLNYKRDIMVVKHEDLWIHSPQFMKTLGVTIGELFRTKIVHFGNVNTANFLYTMLFIDTHFNRFIVSFEKSGEDISMSVRMPRSETKIAPDMKWMTETELADPALSNSGLAVIAQDVSCLWLVKAPEA